MSVQEDAQEKEAAPKKPAVAIETERGRAAILADPPSPGRPRKTGDLPLPTRCGSVRRRAAPQKRVRGRRPPRCGRQRPPLFSCAVAGARDASEPASALTRLSVWVWRKSVASKPRALRARGPNLTRSAAERQPSNCSPCTAPRTCERVSRCGRRSDLSSNPGSAVLREAAALLFAA